jgi:hypothetical protein
MQHAKSVAKIPVVVMVIRVELKTLELLATAEKMGGMAVVTTVGRMVTVMMTVEPVHREHLEKFT